MVRADVKETHEQLAIGLARRDVALDAISKFGVDLVAVARPQPQRSRPCLTGSPVSACPN